jgi:SAM-dependent methyltransferase
VDDSPASAGEREAIYADRSYFVKDDGPAANGYQGDYLADRPFIEAKFDLVLAHLERYVAPGLLLDVGAGPGFLVGVAARRGWTASGVDLNPWAAEHARRELGVDVQHGTLDGLELASGSLDAVTLMDVVEHVPDPDALLAEVGRVVRPGGTVALLTPDAGAPMSRLAGRRWPEVQMPGEHPVLFSRWGLASALARHGLASVGWHSIGKRATVATLAADLAGAAPALAGRVRGALAHRRLGQVVVDLDPHTKFCLYAQRVAGDGPAVPSRPPRLAKRI